MTRTNWITWLAAASSLIALGASQSACTTTDCGTGTIDKAGECVPATEATDNATCGAGTKLSMTTGKCEAVLPPTKCDPDTTEQTTVDGVIVCVGTGGGGCNGPIACGTPTSGKMTICGQLYDIETSMPIQASAATGAKCDPTKPSADGPCAMSISAYDALLYAQNGPAAPMLASDEVVIDDCGRFRLKNLQIGGVQYVGIGLDDNAAAADTHRQSGVALPAIPSKLVTGFPAYGLKVSTDTKWSSDAGIGTPTFAQRGVYMGIFLHGQAPVSGVKITRAGSMSSTDDYYFSDASPATRTTVDPAQSTTGANGSGLMIGGGGLVMYSGTGGETTSCKWPSDLGDQITNVAFIQPRVEVQTANTAMLCP